MKKLFFTALAVLAFSGSGFAEGKEVKTSLTTFGGYCYAGAAAGFNSVIRNGGTITAAWNTYYDVLFACQSNTYISG